MIGDTTPTKGEPLIPGIVQDARGGRVLMLAYLNREAFDKTLETGEVHFWSRSRKQLWRKGETSGNTLRVVELAADCDADALLIRAEPAGPTCHTGAVSCFEGGTPLASLRTALPAEEERGDSDEETALEKLWDTIVSRTRERPSGSYTVRLLEGGVDLAGRKVLEEAGEVLLAAKDHAAGTADDRRLAEEAADLIYHLLVLLAERDVPYPDVLEILEQRAG